MIAGATCTDCSIGMYMAFSKTPVFSTKQSVTAYDKGAKGMLIGEGSVMYVLKRWDAAMRDGDQIHAVIRSCASSSDGKAPGIYAPTIEGQQLAISRAYQHAGVDPATVTLVEGHGTGTPVGDAIELTALKNVLGEGRRGVGVGAGARVAVGSVKSNIGHLVGGGVAGMMKVILALKHKTLPASINVKEPPKMRTAPPGDGIFINTERLGSRRRAAARRRLVVRLRRRQLPLRDGGVRGGVHDAVPRHAMPSPILIAAPARRRCSPRARRRRSSGARWSPRRSGDRPAGTGRRRRVRRSSRRQRPPRGVPAARASASSPPRRHALTASGQPRARKAPAAKWTLPKQGAHFRAAIETRARWPRFSGQGSQYANMFDDAAMAGRRCARGERDGRPCGGGQGAPLV